jgi:PKD repeat protein
VKEIVASPGQQGIVVGYTYKPGTWSTGAIQDAIVYRHDYFNGGNARNLTHEIGHWLNLAHTFGNTNNPGVTCGDDGLSDTPPTKGAFSTCPSSLSGNVCAGSGGQTNVENFMDYSSCPKNFTTDQTNAMRTALASSISGRMNLWQTANLLATDVDGVGPCCAPIAEFLSSNNAYTVCSGGTLQFKDFSYNGQATSYSWNADNGAMVSTPTSSNTSVVFGAAGVSNVTLTVSNSLGTSVKIRPVYVLDGTAGIIGPHYESFEQLGLPSDWKMQNLDPGTPEWEVNFPSYAYNGIGAYYIDAYNAGAGQVDILETPIIDMQNSPVKKFEFAYAYARRTGTHNAELKVAGSTDCGGTWSDILTLSAAQLQNGSGGIVTDPFTPTIEDEWNLVDLSVYPGATSAFNLVKNSPNLIIRFTFKEITGNGNNIYLDAINLPGNPATALNKYGRNIRMNLYPNPSTGATQLEFGLNDAADVKVSVFNVLGAEVLRVAEGRMNAGEQKVIVNGNEQLTPGVYFVNLSVGGQVTSAKMIIE